jgi:hypothetical protein
LLQVLAWFSLDPLKAFVPGIQYVRARIAIAHSLTGCEAENPPAGVGLHFFPFEQPQPTKFEVAPHATSDYCIS